MAKPKSAVLYMRVTPELKQAFTKKAKPYGTASEVLRELVLAYIDGRLTVSPRSIT